jgi:alpha-tubulin suppressor-like RCC1 family protein
MKPATFLGAIGVAALASACNLITGLDGYEKVSSGGGGGGVGGGTGGAGGSPPTLSQIIDATAGPTGTCIVTAELEAYCWGRYPGRDGLSFSLTPVRADLTGKVLSIVIGANHRCAQVGEIDADGTKLVTELWCWGDNDRGQLGTGSGPPSLRPVKVQGVDSIVFDRWSAGHSHVCAAENSGDARLYCWGANNWGQAGTGDTVDVSVPALVAVPDAGAGGGGVGGEGGGAVGAASWNGILTAGTYHSCAIVNRGAIQETYCWGRNDRAQLAQDPTDVPMALEPMRVDDSQALLDNFGHFDRVFGGGEHTCARAQDDDKPIYCWGANLDGQLGDGTTSAYRAAPKRVTLGPINSMYLGAHHTCASFGEATTFSVQCWGANDLGQINLEATDYQASAAPILFGDAVGFATQKADHACAQKSDGSLWCWGANESGQLGTGATSAFERSPQLVYLP